MPATGPGIRVTVEDPKGEISLTHLLDGIEELRNAGVEAMEINDRVRVVAQTSFEDDPEGVRVDGVVLKPPYVIDAIGDPDTLAGALDFQGGFIDDVELDGGSVVGEEAGQGRRHRDPVAPPAPLGRAGPRAVASCAIGPADDDEEQRVSRRPEVHRRARVAARARPGRGLGAGRHHRLRPGRAR